MASNDFFAVYNSNQPTRLGSIPGDFYTIRKHKVLRRNLHDILAEDARKLLFLKHFGRNAVLRRCLSNVIWMQLQKRGGEYIGR
jgi:hypothetical protein